MAGPRKDGTLPTGLITSGRVAVSAAASGDAAAPAAPVVMGAPVGAALLPPGMLPLAVPGMDQTSYTAEFVGVAVLTRALASAQVVAWAVLDSLSVLRLARVVWEMARVAWAMARTSRARSA